MLQIFNNFCPANGIYYIIMCIFAEHLTLSGTLTRHIPSRLVAVWMTHSTKKLPYTINLHSA